MYENINNFATMLVLNRWEFYENFLIEVFEYISFYIYFLILSFHPNKPYYRIISRQKTKKFSKSIEFVLLFTLFVTIFIQNLYFES